MKLEDIERYINIKFYLNVIFLIYILITTIYFFTHESNINFDLHKYIVRGYFIFTVILDIFFITKKHYIQRKILKNYIILSIYLYIIGFMSFNIENLFGFACLVLTFPMSIIGICQINYKGYVIFGILFLFFLMWIYTYIIIPKCIHSFIFGSKSKK